MGSEPKSGFHVMAKPRGPICNLDCSYCYYLAKDELYPASDFRMPPTVLERFTEQYIDGQDTPEVTFAWQGGEPTLLGLDFFRSAVELQQRYKRPGQAINNAFQTNGTTLDAEWCAFLRDNNFLVGISIDGPRALHDLYRVDKGGGPSFDRVMAGVELLRAERVEFNVLTTVHAGNQDHALEVYHFLRDKVHARFIQFIPIVQRQPGVNGGAAAATASSPTNHRSSGSRQSVSARGYGAFLSAVFDDWVRRDVGAVSVQIFEVALAAWAGVPPGLCIFQPTCGSALSLEHNGDVYSCDHFVEPEHLVGNLVEQPLAALVASEQQQVFGQAKADLPLQCQSCEVRFICNGGCPKNRFLETPPGEPDLNYLCAGYRRFFNHIDPPMRVMARELRVGRSPAGVMGALRSQESQRDRSARVRPNEPCPCGSGRKFKQSHGR
jgi:uncharacterized protein